MSTLIAKLLPITVDHTLTIAQMIEGAGLVASSAYRQLISRSDQSNLGKVKIDLFGTVEFRQTERLFPTVIVNKFIQLGLRSPSLEEVLAFASQHPGELEGSPLIGLKALTLKRCGYPILFYRDGVKVLDVAWDNIISGELVHYRFLVASARALW